jgi:hypothetical protein
MTEENRRRRKEDKVRKRIATHVVRLGFYSLLYRMLRQIESIIK